VEMGVSIYAGRLNPEAQKGKEGHEGMTFSGIGGGKGGQQGRTQEFRGAGKRNRKEEQQRVFVKNAMSL